MATSTATTEGGDALKAVSSTTIGDHDTKHPVPVSSMRANQSGLHRSLNGDLVIDHSDHVAPSGIAAQPDGDVTELRKVERPKSAWKSRQRQPRFTDEMIVSESNDLDAEIDTMVLLDDSYCDGSDGMRTVVNGFDQNDIDSEIDRPSANHGVLENNPHGLRIADRFAAQLTDPNDWLPSKLNPLTPRAWQPKDDTAADNVASTSLQLELRLALDDEPDSDVPSLDASGSGSGFQRHHQLRRRGSDAAAGTPPSGGWSSDEIQPVIVNGDWSNTVGSAPSWVKNNPGEHEQLGKSGIISGEALVNIHKKVLEKYQQHVTTSASVAANYAKHDRYAPLTSPKSTAPMQSGDVFNCSDPALGTESKIPVPVRKLAPIDKRIKQRDGNRKHGDRRRGKREDEHGTVLAFLSSSSTFVKSDADGPGVGRKVRLKPLIGRRAKALFSDTAYGNDARTTHDATVETTNDETIGVMRGATFTTHTADQTLGGFPTSRIPENMMAEDYNKLTSSGSRDVPRIPVDDVPDITNEIAEKDMPRYSDNDDNNNNSNNNERPNAANGRDEAIDTPPMMSTYPPYRADAQRYLGPASVLGNTLMHSGTDQQRNVIGNSRDTEQIANKTQRLCLNDADAGLLLADDLNLQEFSLYPSKPRQRKPSNKPLDHITSVTTQRDASERPSEHLVYVVSREQPALFAVASTSSNTVSSVTSNTDSSVQLATSFNKSGQPVAADRRTKPVNRDSNAPQVPSRSLVQPGRDGRDEPQLPISMGPTTWDPQFSLTDMWKQLQTTSQIPTSKSIGSLKTASGGDRVPSYM